MSDNLPQTTIPSLSPTSVIPGVPATDVNFSNHNGTTTVEPPVSSPSLFGSFAGLLHPRYYIFTNRYHAHAKHPDKEIRNMVIDQKSIKWDLQGIHHLIHQLESNPKFEMYCNRENPASASRILGVLETPRGVSTFIYLAGHTERRAMATDDQSSRADLVFRKIDAPADYLDSSSSQHKVISYETMRQVLLKDPRSAPLLFITEVCECDNFLRLPYMLEYEEKEAQPRWEKTKYHGNFPEDSSDIVHFAATSPGELSVSFPSIGAVFTKALVNIKIDPSKPLSLKDIAKQLSENVNTILRNTAYTQRPRIYCSRKMDDPDFFRALGFYSRQGSNSSVGGDSDSNM